MRNILHCSCLLTDLTSVELYDDYLDIEDIPLNHFESQTDDDLPLMNIKTRVEEYQKEYKNKQKAKKMNSKYLFIIHPPLVHRLHYRSTKTWALFLKADNLTYMVKIR